MKLTARAFAARAASVISASCPSASWVRVTFSRIGIPTSAQFSSAFPLPRAGPGHLYHAIVDLPKTVHAHKQVKDACALQLQAEIFVGKRDGVGDQGRLQADLIAVLQEFLNARVDGRFASLQIDGVISVHLNQGLANVLRLLQRDELMFRVICAGNTIREIAEVTFEIAGLTEPDHSSAAKDSMRGESVPVPMDGDWLAPGRRG